MKRVRVLHLVEHLYLGGIERLLEQIALNSTEQTELYFFTYETPSLAGIGKAIKKLGFPVFHYKKQPGRDWKLVSRLIDVIKANNIEVIHTHDFGPMEYAFILKLRFPWIKLIHTQHTMHHFIIKPHYRWFFQVVSYFYSRIIGVSGFVKNSIETNCPWVNRRALQVIPNGVNTEVFLPQITSAKSPLNELTLVSVARISYEKNLDYLIKTCRMLKDANIPFKLHHAGTSKLPQTKEHFDKLIQELGLQEEVITYGYVEDATQILKQADIFISSSLREGHPVALLEAMACQKICICSDIDPHRETAHGAIELFDVQDPRALFEKLKFIYENKPDLSEKRQQARKVVVQNYSIEKMVGSYVGLYWNQSP